MQLILQLGVILVAAHTSGYLFRRFLHLPHLLGHVTAGIVIGPFALGGLQLFGFPALFPAISGIIASVGLTSAVECIFGYAQHELIGRNVNVLMPMHHREQHDLHPASFH